MPLLWLHNLGIPMRVALVTLHCKCLCRVCLHWGQELEEARAAAVSLVYRSVPSLSLPVCTVSLAGWSRSQKPYGNGLRPRGLLGMAMISNPVVIGEETEARGEGHVSEQDHPATSGM